jgi:hypothetical protein
MFFEDLGLGPITLREAKGEVEQNLHVKTAKG